MYERFTDRCRKVMQLANEAAQNFNHEYIGTEHLLLGLIAEGSGVAANVLKNLDLDLRKVRLEVERIIQRGPDPVPMESRLPQTPGVKKVIEYAMAESKALGHKYIGTEHLLLGLLREYEGVAAQVLMNHGLKLQQVRDEVLSLLGYGIRSVQTATPSRREIDDLPTALKAAAAELDAEIARIKLDKEQAIAVQEFERAAVQRDEGEKIWRRKKAMIRDWIANRSIEPSWLTMNDGAVLKIAQKIEEEHGWDALPKLADALEQAGCADAEIIDHCRQPSEHANRCWVVDVLLAKASPKS
jgi:hypothetical protein